MSTDPAGIPAMTPTATGYDLTAKPPPRHRALMTATTARLNFEAKVGLGELREPGRHVNPGRSPWIKAAEDFAQVYEFMRGTR